MSINPDWREEIRRKNAQILRLLNVNHELRNRCNELQDQIARYENILAELRAELSMVDSLSGAV